MAPQASTDVPSAVGFEEETRKNLFTGETVIIAQVRQRKNMPIFYQIRSPAQGRTSSLSFLPLKEEVCPNPDQAIKRLVWNGF